MKRLKEDDFRRVTFSVQQLAAGFSVPVELFRKGRSDWVEVFSTQKVPSMLFVFFLVGCCRTLLRLRLVADLLLFLDRSFFVGVCRNVLKLVLDLLWRL